VYNELRITKEIYTESKNDTYLQEKSTNSKKMNIFEKKNGRFMRAH
jgi:hypothetical protein